MAFDHDHRPKLTPSHDHDHDQETHRPLERRRLAYCIWLTGAMMIVEWIAGWMVNSLALMSDAGHMLTHFFALAVSYVAIYFANRPPTSRVTYGFYRVEILAALLNGITLMIITIGICITAYSRVLHPPLVDTTPMLGVAVVGLLVNVVTALLLHGASKQDLNIKGAYLHMLGDTLSSLAVIGGGVLMWWKGWYIVDPLLSIGICLWILLWSWRLIRDSTLVLMEATPKQIDVDAVRQALVGNITEIQDVHDIHVWTITSGLYAMTAHVRVPDLSVSATMRIRAQAATLLDDRFDINHTILQFECPDVPIPAAAFPTPTIR